MLKLEMRAALLVVKPTVFMQPLQNLPCRHIIIIRVFYTYVQPSYTKKEKFA
jgi:hypothetical protein